MIMVITLCVYVCLRQHSIPLEQLKIQLVQLVGDAIVAPATFGKHQMHFVWTQSIACKRTGYLPLNSGQAIARFALESPQVSQQA